MIDYRRPFAAVRKDPHWKRKIGLGVLVGLIPYFGMVWMLGWQMDYQRSVAWGDDEHVPGWSDPSRQALLGLKGLVAALPYSLAMSIVIVPVALLPAVAAISAAPSDGGPQAAAGIGIACALEFFVMMGFSLLILPLVDSAMLRVALFGTFESGFQFKEIWRLMREHRPELMRAWRFSALNIAISFGAMILFFGLIGLLMVLLPGVGGDKAMTMLILGVAGYFLYIPFAMALGLFLSLTRMHYFGRFGRVAYGLEALRGDR